MIEALLFGIGGAIVNRIRGGGLVSVGNMPIMLVFWFAAAMYMFTLGGGHNPWGIPDYATAFLLILSIYIGETFGWGRYFGAMKDPISKFKTPKDYEETAIIDWAIKGLIPSKHEDSKKEYTLKTRLWGVTGMTLRGLLWMVLPAITLASVLPLVVGSTMGVVYYVSRKVKHHWEQAELIFGFIMGVGLYYALQ